MQLAELFVTVRADMSDFQDGMDKIKNNMQNIGQNMQNVGANLTKYVSLPLAAVGAAALHSAMELEASQAKYETVFAGMTESSDAFIREFQKLTPATTAEARNMASGMQDLLVPMGIARDEATRMTGEFMHVAGALTNFNSGTHTAADVTRALQSAMTGQYDSLKALGIQLDVNTVKQKAVEMGLVSNVNEVTKATQAQVLLAEIYAQSGDALNAYTEENLDAKTQLGLLKAEALDVAAKFGEVMLPILRDVIEVVRGAIEWFGGLTEGQRKVIVIVGALAAALGPLLLVLGSLIVAMPALVAGVGAVGTAFTLFTGPVGLAVAAVGALIAAFALLRKNWDKVKGIFGSKKFSGSIVDDMTGDIIDLANDLQVAPTLSTVSTNTGSSNTYIELDGRTIAKSIGDPLIGDIRLKTGLSI